MSVVRQRRKWSAEKRWRSISALKYWILIISTATTGCHQAQSNDAVYHNAEAFFKKGDLTAALAQAGDGFRRCGSSPEWCWKFRLLKAEILLAMGQSEAALGLLDVTGNPPTPDLQARRSMYRGEAFFRLTDYPHAEKALGEARTLAIACDSPLLIAEVEVRQGPVFERMGRFGEADATSRHALQAAIDAGDLYLQANAMGNLGFVILRQFRYEEALYWLQKTHDLAEQIGATTLAAHAVGNMGECYYGLGDFEKAFRDYVEAESRMAQAGNRRAQQAWLGHSAKILLETGNFAGANDRYKRASTIARELGDRGRVAEWLNSLALVNIQTGQLDAADQYNNESLAINKKIEDHAQELYNRLRSAQIATRRQQFDSAEKLFESLLNSADPALVLAAQGGLADLYVQTGDKVKAEARFRAAIAIIESGQTRLTKDDDKLSYHSSLVRFYQSYVDFLVQQGADDHALEVAESSRARILIERAKTGAAVPHELRSAELQALARSSHRIFLSYWLASKQSYVWVITPAKIERFDLPPEKEIGGLVESYRTAIEDLRDPIQSHHPAGEKLSQILLGRIRELVPAGSRVTIVPDGALHSLNFETLPGVRDPSKYWIEDVTLSVAPSLALLLNSRPAKKSRPSLLAIADPLAPEQYSPLPYARNEVEAIAGLFSAANKVVYHDKDSRPSAYDQAGRFSLIHFAAHATANRASPLDSALILSREGNEYTLTARRIMTIPLNADLVTLSSCRSAGARAYSGEGLVGLTWAFLQMGARRVIAGLWDVNDKSTSILMSKLYVEVTSGRPPEEALRAAKLRLLHDGYPYRNPYYWGPFQLYTGTEK